MALTLGKKKSITPPAELQGMGDDLLVAEFEKIASLICRQEQQLTDVAHAAVALVVEAATRTTGLRAYPGQIEGVHALLDSSIAELATGEGKTLVTAIAAVVCSLEKGGVHVATVNAYLAERDFEFTKPLAQFFGKTIGLIKSDDSSAVKKDAYQCHITYGTGYDFGFDYLRDQIALLNAPRAGATANLKCHFEGRTPPESPCVQRGLARAIVDEMDSVLIDEAGSPLVIAQSVPKDSGFEEPYQLAQKMVEELDKESDFILDRTGRQPVLTPEGRRRVHDSAKIPWDRLRRPWQKYIVNALAANHGYRKDEHFIIKDEKVVIVDEFTGRAHAERNWQQGLHQAVEAAQGVVIQPESESAASITRQRYFGLYQNLSGLTGTASESAKEFRHFFKLRVKTVPEHRPSRKQVLPDRIFRTREIMIRELAAEIVTRHATGQPVLVGTRTVRMSEMIHEAICDAGLHCRVLNALKDKEESEIVEEAGKAGKILIATNMAGRGTHISVPPESIKLGGLHVIGVERSESIRIDRQLIGRGARQGQPGSCQFFLSTEDHLFEAFAPHLGKYLRLQSIGKEELGKQAVDALKRVQRKVERIRYSQRLSLAQRDIWIDDTRRSLA